MKSQLKTILNGFAKNQTLLKQEKIRLACNSILIIIIHEKLSLVHLTLGIINRVSCGAFPDSDTLLKPWYKPRCHSNSDTCQRTLHHSSLRHMHLELFKCNNWFLILKMHKRRRHKTQVIYLNYAWQLIRHFSNNILDYIPSMNIHEHSKNVIGQLLLAE